jgi:preprotein translocase subunit YajC
MSEFIINNTDKIMLWVGAFCTLGLYSMLYKENRIYRLFEHIFLGLATGYLVSQQWTDVLQPKWWKPMWEEGKWWFVFIVLFGSFYYFIFSKKFSWVARIIIGFFLGVASGQSFQAYANDYWPQIPSTFKPIFPHAANPAQKIPELTWSGALNNLIFMVIVFCVMSYFFFSFEQKTAFLKNSAKLGRWLMMFTFGAIFGSTIMARLALLIDRMDFLLNEFGKEVMGSAGSMFAVLLALMGLVLYLALVRDKKKEEAEEI